MTTMTLEQHAEAILRALDWQVEDGLIVYDRESFLAACAALFDAGAVAMREVAEDACQKRADRRFEEFGVTEPDTNASYYSGRRAETLEELDEEDDACASAIRAIDPASLRQSLPATSPELPEGLYGTTDGKLYFNCRACDKQTEFGGEPEDFSQDTACCGGSPRCIP